MLFVPCFVLLLIYDHPKAATVLFLIAAVTDGLDGLIARKLQQKTVLGSFEAEEIIFPSFMKI